MINIPLIIALSIVSLPVFGMLGHLFFGDRDGFLESIYFLFIPDIISLLRGEYWEDRWAEIKLTMWGIGCVLVIFSEYDFVHQHLPRVFAFFEQYIMVYF